MAKPRHGFSGSDVRAVMAAAEGVLVIETTANDQIAIHAAIAAAHHARYTDAEADARIALHAAIAAAHHARYTDAEADARIAIHAAIAAAHHARYTDAEAIVAGKTIKLNEFAAPDGAISMSTQKITNVVDPDSDQDAATKHYVDNVASGAIVGYRIATGEAITIGNYQQLQVSDQYIIEGTGVLIVNGSGIFCIG